MSYQRVGAYVAEWGEELQTQYQIWQQENRPSSVPAKRSASGQDDLTVRAKKAKTASGDQGINDAGMKKLFDANDINTVKQLFIFGSSWPFEIIERRFC